MAAAREQQGHEERLNLVFRRQHGVASRPQLLAAGASAGLIRRRLDSGAWVTLRRAVYALAVLPRAAEQDLLAACLAAGPEAYASHRGAAWLWGLLEEPVVEMTVPVGGRTRMAGVTLHRSDDRTGLSVRRGIPTTNPLRTLFDLAAVATEEQLVLAFDRGVSRRLFTPHAAAADRTRRAGRGRRGSAPLGAVLRATGPLSTRSPSVLQARMARLLSRSRLPLPAAEYEVLDGRYRLDFAYPAAGLGIEMDSLEHHGGPAAFRRDAGRHTELAAAGWRLLRFTWRDVAERPDWVTARIREALTAAEAS